jgi:ketosteroid isomerase-like protein
MTHPNAELITHFYEAFAKRDGDAMAAAYAPDATFTDPVFPALRGAEVGAMWRMLCKRGADLVITFRDVHADDQRGRAHWEATYSFSATGRRVHNVVDATFEFEGGKIKRHVDDFAFYRWSRMALGPLGFALGWTPLVRKKVQSQARAALDLFMPKN